MNSGMEKGLVIKSLIMALHGRQAEKGLLHHSDRGSQYASNEYQKLFKDNLIDCSMSRKGNAPEIRFHLRSSIIMQQWKACRPDVELSSGLLATLKQELVYLRQYQTRKEAKLDIFE